MNVVQKYMRLTMNILKKLVIGVVMATNSAVLCSETNLRESVPEVTEEVRNSYNYWGIGAGIPTFLSCKFGHREQVGHRGFEYGLGMTPLVYITEAHLFVSSLYYPRPNLNGQSYFGIGLKGGGFLELNRAKFGYIAPGFILGRERLARDGQRKFTQVAFGLGALTTEGLQYFPSISLTFGYGF